MYLTKAQRNWASKVEELMASIPDGIELVIRPGRADIVPAGFEDRELMGDLHAAGQSITNASVLKIPLDRRVVPVSEDI